MTPARLAAQITELLGPVRGALLVTGAPRLGAVLASCRPVGDGGAPAAAVVSFLGDGARPAERQGVLAEARKRLPPDAPLVVIDHNQPRAVWRRALNVPLLLVAGFGPSRARYPTARELAALGLHVERLTLACGERVQIVLTRTPAAKERAAERPTPQTRAGVPGVPSGASERET